MRYTITIIYFFLQATKLFSQVPTIEWQHYYGGYSFETLYDGLETSDGSYVFVGTTNSTASMDQDVYVVKVNSLGIVDWEKYIGGDLNDEGTSIKQTLDGGYIILGFGSTINGPSNINHGQTDICIVKLDSLGNVVWQNNYGGSDYDISRKIVQTADGGYLISANTSSTDGDVAINYGYEDIWLIKINSLGVIEWEKTYGGIGYENLNGLIQTSDGNFVFSGSTSSPEYSIHGYYDVLVVKIDPYGNIIWQKVLGGTDWDYSGNIIQTTDGGYAVACSTISTDDDVTSNHGGFFDFWLIKLNSEGDISWQKTYGGSDGEQMTDVYQTTDGGYVMSGLTYSIDGDVSENFGGSDFWVVKTSASGDIIWQKSIGTTSNEEADVIFQTTDGSIVVAGPSDTYSVASEALVVKFSNDALATQNQTTNNSLVLYPNPTTDYFKINNLQSEQIKIYDLQGKFIKEFKFQEKFDIQSLSEGEYIVNIISDSKTIKSIRLMKR